MKRTAAVLGILVLASGLWILRTTDQGEGESEDLHADRGVPSSEARPAGETARRAEATSFSGVVSSKAGPVGSVRICAEAVAAFPNVEDVPFCVLSGRDGRYSMSLESARYEVSAAAEGYLPVAGVDVDLRRGDRVLDLLLRPGGAEVGGVVRDRAGSPIAGARLSVASVAPGFGFPGVSVTSDERGRWRGWVGEGEVEVQAEHDGYARAVANGNAPGRIDVSMVPEGVIAGRVFDREHKAPVDGVSVYVGKRWARTSGGGYYRVGGLPAGRYVAFVDGDGWYGRASRVVALAPTGSVLDVDIEVLPSNLSLGGRVETPDGGECTKGEIRALRKNERVSQR